MPSCTTVTPAIPTRTIVRMVTPITVHETSLATAHAIVHTTIHAITHMSYITTIEDMNKSAVSLPLLRLLRETIHMASILTAMARTRKNLLGMTYRIFAALLIQRLECVPEYLKL